MSDVEKKSVDKEELVLPLGKIAIFFIIGYALRILNMTYFEEALPIPHNWKGYINEILVFGATGVMFLPMWIKIILGGWSAALDVPDYAVVTTTTYSDGTVEKSSDYGQEAEFMGVIMHVIWFCLGYFVAAFVTLGILLFQMFTFITSFPRIRNKIAYLITLAVILTFFIAGPSIARRLAPVFDPVHFNTEEIAKAAETSQKNLFAGNFSYAMGVKAKRKDMEKKSYTANVSYTKATDTTVIDITGNSGSLRDYQNQQERERILQRAAETYMERFDKGKNKVPLGRYTFVGNDLKESIVAGDRKLSNAAIAEITNMLPVNLIFNRMHNDRLRMTLRDDKNLAYNVNIQSPEGTSKKRRVSLYFLKTDDDYKLINFTVRPYEIDVKVVYESGGTAR